MHLCDNCERKNCDGRVVRDLQNTNCVISCSDYVNGNRAPTNADRIRAMSDEELAKFFGRHGFCCDNIIIPSSYCMRQKECSLKCVVNWLKQPAEADQCQRIKPGSMLP